ncbi:RUS1 family [Hypsizygus marmoreus]|uniref:RUS1 family n=1 Tax=Hypsizygus marmoreus TaxID=39966 RepID=A0A369KA11_HYPMA|nr:RUS1 family [Hypsizygus marmoreus]
MIVLTRCEPTSSLLHRKKSRNLESGLGRNCFATALQENSSKYHVTNFKLQGVKASSSTRANLGNRIELEVTLRHSNSTRCWTFKLFLETNSQQRSLYMVDAYIVFERDYADHLREIHVSPKQIRIQYSPNISRRRTQISTFLTKVFLPSGYPSSVSPDYLRYQILNALQAFCNSLAGLLSSRAVLEGFGVGDPSATATHALLITVVQDVFSRLTTIFGAYHFGSSLVPEAKTYRFLADVLNDAGGSKAAITLHFATPVAGTGDVGDLNAKDSSKETVLALLGMLLGTLIVPHLSTPGLTYGALFLLVALHLIINYLGVRGLELRSLNRQRAGIAWNAFRLSGGVKVPSPAEISKLEKILGQPDVFRDDSGRIIGRCIIGSSFSDVFRGPFPARLLSLFEQERYLLWYDHQSLSRSSDRDNQTIRAPLRLHILLKEGYGPNDQLKAWIHAAELCRTNAHATQAVQAGNRGDDESSLLIHTTYRQSAKAFPTFIRYLRDAGWNTDDVALMAGSPKAVLTGIEPDVGVNGEKKKIR